MRLNKSTGYYADCKNLKRPFQQKAAKNGPKLLKIFALFHLLQNVFFEEKIVKGTVSRDLLDPCFSMTVTRQSPSFLCKSIFA